MINMIILRSRNDDRIDNVHNYITIAIYPSGENSKLYTPPYSVPPSE